MINRTLLVGRLTKDPELRRTAQGTAVTSFNLAVDRIKADSSGQDADFIPVVCWNKLAENVAQYTVKGSLVGVDGRLRSRSYDDKNGRRVYVVEVLADTVQFLDNRKKEQDAPKNDYYTNDYYNPPF